jgi:hypothetical protein
LGNTAIPQDIFHEFLGQISARFTEFTYNILTHNCNNFTDTAAQFLLGSGIPADIISLPERVMASPMGRQLLQPMFDQMQGQMTRYHGAHQIGTSQVNTSAVSPQLMNPSVPVPQFNGMSLVPASHPSVPNPMHRHQGITFSAITYWRPSLFSTGKISLILPKLKELVTQSGGQVPR